MSPQERIRYLSLLIFSMGAGVSAYIFGGDYIVNNEKAQDVVVNLFSILAGFIIAIMTLLSDASLRPGSWGRMRGDAEVIRRRLDRQQYLFWLYLVTLSVVLTGRLLQAKSPELSSAVQKAGFGLAVMSLVLSFALPVVLRSTQVARMDAAVTKSKEQSSRLGRS